MLQEWRKNRSPSSYYVIIFRFAKAGQLEAWESSHERAQLLAEVKPMTEHTTVEKVSGMEYWFQLPGHAGKAPPPRHEMAVVTVLAIYPLVMFFVPFMGGLLKDLPHPAATFFTACTMVVLMTWIVMPLMTRLFARWLFPA